MVGWISPRAAPLSHSLSPSLPLFNLTLSLILTLNSKWLNDR